MFLRCRDEIEAFRTIDCTEDADSTFDLRIQKNRLDKRVDVGFALSIQPVGRYAIQISWSDGTTTRWTVSELRRSCPCATCRDERSAGESSDSKPVGVLPVLSPAEAQPLRIEAMNPVGSYAYNIVFSDGHSSGIFTFAMLYRS